MAFFLVSAEPQTCPADSGGKCSGSDDWEGEFFPEIPHIKYELSDQNHFFIALVVNDLLQGPNSSNPLAYKWYNAEEEIPGKKMNDWFRFSVAFWLTFRGTGGDPFGAATKYWPWEDGTNSVAMESNKNLDEVIELAKELQKAIHETKIRPLWGTAQLFLHPRYMHGGATSSEKAMEVTHYLGGENYVFWGGREGYQTLLNTDMGRELDHMARFFQAAYDWDAATSANFLRKYELINEFKLNIECNHATLSGHTCHHVREINLSLYMYYIMIPLESYYEVE
ncbi:hypothetical protein HID58_004966 [Brassica napus]|uniref:xylose isomerase n=1 Tax=Brassica napus TaxID=3708 RepID=A0ABQ8E7A7_BRANA|nr:hypothetical protein HID58_004966 [Brassica napus]